MKHIELTAEQRLTLESIVSTGTHKARDIKRSRALLALAEDLTLQEIAAQVGYSQNTISRIKREFSTRGLKVIHDRPRSGAPRKIDGIQEAKLTALACTDPPEGNARWSLRLLADKAVELDYIDEISHTQVGRVLKKTNSNLIVVDSGASAK